MKAFLALAALAATFGASGEALTASNAVADAPAGIGSAAISGVAVLDVTHAIDADKLSSVSFTVAPAPDSTIRIRVRPDGPWHSCALIGANATCATPGETLATATELAVVVA